MHALRLAAILCVVCTLLLTSPGNARADSEKGTVNDVIKVRELSPLFLGPVTITLMTDKAEGVILLAIDADDNDITYCGGGDFDRLVTCTFHPLGDVVFGFQTLGPRVKYTLHVDGPSNEPIYREVSSSGRDVAIGRLTERSVALAEAMMRGRAQE